MPARSFIIFFLFWFHWQTALGQNIATLNRMAAPERLIWARHFVDQELNLQDSATAFQQINTLLDLAKKWDAPELKAEMYAGQSNYFLQVLADPVDALRSCKEGLDFANDHNLEIAAAGFLLQTANVYRQAKQPISAYEYYFRAHEVFERLGFAQIPRIDRYEYEIGRFLYELEDYKTALDHLSIANQFSGSASSLRCEIFLLMAACYREIGSDAQVLESFHKSLLLSQKENDRDKMIRSSIGVGECQLQDKNYSEARIYLTTAYNWAQQDAQFTAAAQALILLAKVNIRENNLHAAAQKLTEAETYVQRSDAKTLSPELYRAWMTIYEGLDNYREAYRYRQMYDRTRDSIQSVAFLQASANIQLRLEARVRLAQMVQMQTRDYADRMLLLIAVCVIAILTLSGYLLLRYFRRRQRDLLSAKKRAESALEEALQWKGYQLPEGYEPTPEGVAPQARGTAVPLFAEKPTYNTQEALEQILRLSLLTDEDSRNFRQIFERIHPGFFAEIRTNLPELTQAETRLLALTKLNLSTKEMSEILNVEPNSVRRLRNRIRQKLNLPAGDNFEKILNER